MVVQHTDENRVSRLSHSQKGSAYITGTLPELSSMQTRLLDPLNPAGRPLAFVFDLIYSSLIKTHLCFYYAIVCFCLAINCGNVTVHLFSLISIITMTHHSKPYNFLTSNHPLILIKTFIYTF